MTLPEGFAASLQDIDGLDIDALTAALAEPPSVSLRLNSRKPAADPYPAMSPVPWCPSGRYLDTRPVFTLHPLLHAGAFYVQDASSMIHRHIVSELAGRLRHGPEPLSVLDLCAAPGGKTTAVIDALSDGDCMVANEYVPQRAAALRENLSKWGYPWTAVTNSPTSVFAEAGPLFDIVVADVPCSGEGMMRKEAAAAAQWSPALVRQCAALQRDIAADAVRALRPGGYLVYSTCTFNRTENEDNAAAIAEAFGLEPVELDIPASWGIGASCRPGLPAMRFMPHLTRGEGLFVCVLRKPGDEAGTPALPGARIKAARKGAASKPVAPLPAWIDTSADWTAVALPRGVAAVPRRLAALTGSIGGLHITAQGVEAAETKGRDLVPTTQAVLSTAYRRGALPEHDADRDTALSFLRHEPVILPLGSERGHTVLTYQGIPLGLVKNIGARANNLYPAAWKIRNL